MQARLDIRHFPSMMAVIVLALLVATLALGGALGYALKPASVTSGPSRVIVVPEGYSSGNDSCLMVDKHKAC